MKEFEELRKIEELVFDRRTLFSLEKILSKGIVKRIKGIISMGKEANVYLAEAPSGRELAVKIYKAETAKFKRRKDYLVGDPRFKKISKFDEFTYAVLYAKKEFKNLELATNFGVSCPAPYFWVRNVLVMEFLGEESTPYPQCSDALELVQRAHIRSLLHNLKSLARAKLVHGDLSMYNMLVGKEKLYFIDFGQGVLVDHPSAREFLLKDLDNVLYFISKVERKRGEVYVEDKEALKEDILSDYGF